MKKLTLSASIVLLFLHLMYASDGPGLWTLTSALPGAVFQNCVAINRTNPMIMYAGSNTSGVWKTTDGGLVWNQVNTGLTNTAVQCLDIGVSNPNVLYAGTANGVFITTNAGGQWSAINSGIVESPVGVQAVAVDPTNPAICYIAIFNATANSSNGLYKTTNSGTTWSVANTGIGTIKNFLSFAINPLNPQVLFAGSSFDAVAQTGPSKIYRTNNGAASWIDVSTGLPSATTETKPYRALSMGYPDTARVLAAAFNNPNNTVGAAWLTTNGGGSWSNVSTGLPGATSNNARSCLIRPGSSSIFYIGFDATTPPGGCYITTDAGASWQGFNNGSMTTSNTVRTLTMRFLPDSTIYAGVSAGSMGVHEYTIIPVGIHIQNGNLPSSFALYPNFPNPFNPATYIQYDVPKESFVSLKVYDVAGREVRTVVSETKGPGSYTILFDATNLTSGVYFYTIKAGDFFETKKMILAK
jgi:photosystem II stability/assembly factor-like uncharacterized protein